MGGVDCALRGATAQSLHLTCGIPNINCTLVQEADVLASAPCWTNDSETNKRKALNNRRMVQPGSDKPALADTSSKPVEDVLLQYPNCQRTSEHSIDVQLKKCGLSVSEIEYAI